MADSEDKTPSPQPRSDQPDKTPLDRPEKTPLDRLEPTRFMGESSGSSDDVPGPEGTPDPQQTRGGRFRLKRFLGQGGHAEVYLAIDEHLQRQVALKIPRMDRFAGDQDVAKFLNEARMAAQLHHPGIVTVYDAGVGPEGIYIVLEYVEGTTLDQQLRSSPPTIARAVAMMLDITRAVGHAHQQGLIHRDIKPGNVLVDREDRVRVADFGLALRRDSQRWRQGEVAGTPAFMAPEQVRGESHRLDERTDIWGMGVVMYQMLTGARPFAGGSERELHDEILHRDPRPPRQIAPHIPKELERICTKCLAKRMVDRYASTRELIEDLLACRISGEAAPLPRPAPTHLDVPDVPATESRRSGSKSYREVRVIPKGLRAFDEHDADFFLALLPGPFDREGLPESVRFWKSRAEEVDADQTFFVGLLLGPSGSGKSSLIRAGILPLLADHVLPVYLEATHGDTEAVLKRKLRKLFPGLSPTASLPEMIFQMREGSFLARGQKVLLVLDQFEQWLHAYPAPEQQDLVAALRHCDGAHVQAIVLVRDDFGMAAMRFMNSLELPLVEGKNYGTIDLFDQPHARRVLEHFGRAYETLPETDALSPEQTRFIGHAVAALSEDHRVAPVRLAAFAQMMRDAAWSVSSLQHHGGVEGVGVALLDETIGDRSRNPRWKLHQQAARRVLEVLLPPQVNTNIKGHFKTYQDLKDASGYTDPARFDDLLRTLDTELRLITPVARLDEAQTPVSSSDGSLECAQYQLTHDFLVPSLREWLLQKDRSTPRGRARLRLAELSAVWDAKHEPRHLPSLGEYLHLRWRTRPQDWNEADTRLMHASRTYYVARVGALAVLLVLMALLGLFLRREIAESSLRQRVVDRVAALQAASIDEVEAIIDSLDGLWVRAEPALRGWIAGTSSDEPFPLVAYLALLRIDERQVDPLKDQLCEPWDPTTVLVIRRALAPHGLQCRDELWGILEDRSRPPGHRLRAACGLVQFDVDSPRWSPVMADVAHLLVQENALLVAKWIEAFEPLAARLVAPLGDIFRDRQRSEFERLTAANLLASYAVQDLELLADLIQVATAEQFQVLLPVVRDQRENLEPRLLEVLNERPRWEWRRGLFGVPTAESPVRAIYASRTASADPLESFVDPDLLQDPAAREPLAEKLRAAEGRLADAWAWCWRLHAEDLMGLSSKLGEHGYRPVNVRPYRQLDEDFMAVLWHRDGRRWEIRQNLGPDELRQLVPRQRAAGLIPADVAFMPSPAGHDSDDDGMSQAPRFITLWFQPHEGDPVRDGDLYVLVHDDDHEDYWRPLNDRGFVPRSNLKYHDNRNEAYYTSLRWRLASPPDYSDEWNTDLASINSPRSAAWCQVDVRLVDPFESGFGAEYAGVWWNGGDQASRSWDTTSIAEQLETGESWALQGYRPVALSAWADPAVGQLSTSSVWAKPVVTEQAKDDLAVRQAHVIVALAHLGNDRSLWENLQQSRDNRLRSLLIHRLRPLRFDPRRLWIEYQRQESPSVQRALLNGLATFPLVEIPEDLEGSIVDHVRQLARNTEDPGILAACLFLMRHWNVAPGWSLVTSPEKRPDWMTAAGRGSRKWYATSEKHLMAVVDPPDRIQGTWMGSPSNEPGRDHGKERLHTRRLEHRYALSMHEVTVAQFRRYQENNLSLDHYSPQPDCPVNNITWLEAVKYCRWLSEQEGLAEDEMCYPPADDIRWGMTLPAEFWKRPGYRLPLESEWEYACRAGTETSRYFGHTPELLPNYAWTAENSDYISHPVGSLMPNDWGLYDMLGNVMEWTHGSEQKFPALEHVHGRRNAVRSDGSDVTEWISEEQLCATRGGAFLYQPLNARGAQRDFHGVGLRRAYLGFRIARTMVGSPETP
jgi:serine/threonine protein kinase/formylglycine-generating enzyme required for sulfatase activity